MRRLLAVMLALLALGLAGVRSSTTVAAQGPWTTLFDAKNGLKGWNVIGDANWAVVDGNIQASKGSAAGYLVTPMTYGDFEVTLDFWVTPDANSGVFIRCSDPKTISAMNAYEVNIYDMRPDQTYRTGAIVNIAKPTRVVNTGNKWSSFDITAKGPKMTVKIDGMTIAEGEDSAHPRGAIALQWGAGTVKFKNVRVRTL
jgi:3-keto-disaccharide hydrolase